MSQSDCKIIEWKTCRACNSKNIIPVISLGEQYVSNYIDLDFDYKDEKKVPLELILCDPKSGCGLLQSKHTASREDIYRQYWFRSGLNETMKNALKDITKNAEKIVELSQNDMVLDIGCNDGTLLRTYTSKVFKAGFEPAKNLIDYAKISTDKIINNFFTLENFQNEFGNKKCKVITSIAMFYDLEDPNTFVNDITKILEEDGIWIIQMAYLVPMLELNAFDNIGHEHLEHYSFIPLKKLLEKHGLTIFNVEINRVYGGSIRVYIKKESNNNLEISESIQKIELFEKNKKLNEKKTYEEFSNRAVGIKNKLVEFIEKEVDEGKIIYAYGASTKGNTLLQYCGLNSNLIKKAIDRDPVKCGKKTIGTNIPIISEEDGRKEKPDYFLVLPWHLSDYFKIREKEYLDQGGKFIVPLPKVRIIDKNGERFL